MVVLELEGHTNMLGSGPNQYLQPDYLSPLSSPLDSKASPLALLAQTCSQIGSDGPSAKSIFDTSKRKLSTCSESSLKSESSSDSTTFNNKDGLNNNNHKESSSGGGSASSNSNHRPKSGSSSVSPFNHSSSKKSNAGGGGGKSSPVLRSPNSSPVFKPYELSKPTKEYSGEKNSEKSAASKSSKHNNNSSSSLSRNSANSSPKVKTPNPRSTPPEHKEISVVDSKKGSNSGSGSSANNTDPGKSTSSSASDHGASPIIRSGLEVLQQGQFGSSAAAAEYNKRLSALSSLSALGAAGYPPGFDPLNPAFRPPFFGSPHPHNGLGYPIPGQSPYVSYSRVKTASGAETIVPVCKDPYCTGCQYGGGGVPHGTPVSSASSGASSMNGLMAAAAAAAAAAGFPPSLTGVIPGLSAAATGTSATISSSSASGICPAGCVHPCDHPKFPLSSLPHLFPPSLTSSLAGGYPSSLLSQHSAVAAAAAAAQAQQNATRPYVCNWIVGDNYCGKRFPSSEELLQHLRTHTNSSGANGGANNASASSTSAADSAALAAMVQQQHQLALSSAASPSSSLYSSAAAFLNHPSAMAAAAAAMHLNQASQLSPLSAARYHPYATGKPSSLTGLVPPPPPHIPTSSAAAALSSYYPYSALYAQRLGPSVHQ